MPLDTTIASNAIKAQVEINRLKDELHKMEYIFHHHLTRWVPCSEEMPKHFPCNYLVWGPGMVRSGELWLDIAGKTWGYGPDNTPTVQKITHWMPLPLPPDRVKTLDDTVFKQLEAFKAFAERLLSPEDLGHAVTEEVRDCARVLLGVPPVLHPRV